MKIDQRLLKFSLASELDCSCSQNWARGGAHGEEDLAMADLAAKIAAKARAAAAKMSELQGVGSHHPVTQAVDWNRPLNREAPEASDLIMPMMLPDTAVSNDAPVSTSKHSGVNGALVPVSGKDAHAAAHPQVTLAEYREQVLVAEAKKRKRREGSKWAPTRLEDDEEAKRGRLLAYKTRIDALSTMMESPVPIGRRLPPPGARSPSPPPEYDKSTGQRVNTREQRVYDAWDTERREAVGKALEMDPLYKPPIGHRPLVHELRLYIPHKEHPGYNFMGLIIGPRGNTQKRLERETGAHIRVRGKEMQKEGRSLPPQFPGQDDGRDDELHVHISADSIEKVDRAARMIHPLLTPLDPDQNPHKQKQLRELAELNGTVCDVGKLERARLLQEEDAKHDYKLSKDLQSKVDSMYAKDVATKLAADGKGVGDSAPNDGMDDEYENFLSELTGNLIGEGAVPGHGSKRAAAAAPPKLQTPDAAALAAAARNPWAMPASRVASAAAAAVNASTAGMYPSGPGWAPGAAPEHLRRGAGHHAHVMPPPAGPAPGTASGIVPSVEVHATVHIPSTLAIDARLALRGLYGAGIAAAAAVANSFAARRARELGGNANANANANAAAERKEAVAPPVEATRVTGVGVREEVPEEAVDDEYARMMAELGG